MKNFLLIFCLFAFASSAIAQRPGGGGDRPEPPSAEEMIEKATTDLGLNAEQVKQWQEIHARYEDKSASREEMRASRQEMGKELEATLTEEQLEKYQELRKNRRPPEKRR